MGARLSELSEAIKEAMEKTCITKRPPRWRDKFPIAQPPGYAIFVPEFPMPTFLEPFYGPDRFNIGFCGISGTGKSGFLSMLTNGFAETGAVETTMHPQAFGLDLADEDSQSYVAKFIQKIKPEFQKDVRKQFHNVTLWDLPGAGTHNHPANHYTRDKGLRFFDYVVFMAGRSVMEDETKLLSSAKNIKVRDSYSEEVPIPYVVIRSMMDTVLDSAWARKTKELRVRLSMQQRRDFAAEEMSIVREYLDKEYSGHVNFSLSSIFLVFAEGEVDPDDCSHYNLKVEVLETETAIDHILKQVITRRGGGPLLEGFGAAAELPIETPHPGSQALDDSIDEAAVESLIQVWEHYRPNESSLRSMFASSGASGQPNRFKITSIEVVPAKGPLALAVRAYMGLSKKRRETSSTFAPTNPSDPSKVQVIDHLKRHFCTKDYFPEGMSQSNLVYVWHGVSCRDNLAAARAICQTGFTALQKLDAGYHGGGRYASLEAEYACRYAMGEFSPFSPSPNSEGSFPVLLCLGVVTVAWPLTPCVEDFDGQLPPTSPKQCLYYGRPMKGGYDTHVAPVKGPEFLAADPSDAEYYEVVFNQDDQLLPIALLWIKDA